MSLKLLICEYFYSNIKISARYSLSLFMLIIYMILISVSSCEIENNDLDKYNIAWKKQSKNSSESMPLVGRDMGCNVWVENNSLFFYSQRSGCLSENGEYLKLGRFRLELSPNPFSGNSKFSQELKLKEGYIEINGSHLIDGKELSIIIRLWIDVYSSVVNIDVKSNEPVKISASYESWRTEDKEIKPGGNKNRWGCFSLEGYPGTA